MPRMSAKVVEAMITTGIVAQMLHCQFITGIATA